MNGITRKLFGTLLKNDPSFELSVTDYKTRVNESNATLLEELVELVGNRESSICNLDGFLFPIMYFGAQVLEMGLISDRYLNKITVCRFGGNPYSISFMDVTNISSKYS